jgi:hypothetical protein
MRAVAGERRVGALRMRAVGILVKESKLAAAGYPMLG